MPEHSNIHLPKPVRMTLYIIAITGAAVAPFVAVTSPEYSQAIIVAVSVLSAAAGVTSLTHLGKGVDNE